MSYIVSPKVEMLAELTRYNSFCGNIVSLGLPKVALLISMSAMDELKNKLSVLIQILEV